MEYETECNLGREAAHKHIEMALGTNPANIPVMLSGMREASRKGGGYEAGYFTVISAITLEAMKADFGIRG